MFLEHAVLSAILVTISVLGSTLFADQTTYGKGTSLPSLRITYAELQSVLDKSARLMSAANASLPSGEFSERAQLKHGETQIEISGHQLRGSGAKLPKLVTEFRYIATQYPRRSAPIATVSIIFYDHDRRLEVEGSSPEQVDAVFAALKSDFLGLSSWMGGLTFRSLSGYILLMVCILVAVYGWLNWLATKDQRLILPIFLAGVGTFFLFALPFSEFLAGFSVTDYDPSFASRYGPELAVVGLFLAVAGIPLSYLIPKWFTKRTQPSAPPAVSTPNQSLKVTRRKRRAP